MGSFLTNYQVRSDSLTAVRNALLTLSDGPAYISPPKNGWVTLYHEESDQQDADLLKRIANGLSRGLKTSAFAFLVHDSDIAAYWLFQNGRPVDEFDSDPEYFDNSVDEETRAKLSGNTDALLPLCIEGTTREQIEAVIHPPDGLPTMAEDILSQLSELLGIDEMRITLGYTYFNEEGEDILPDIAEFEPVGRGIERKEASIPEDCDEETPAAMPDMFDLAVAMLTQLWGTAHKIDTSTFAALLKTDREDFLKQLHARFDLSARDLLKKSKLPDRPTLEELKAARDQGPEALAELLARRVPSQLGNIGMGAVTAGQAEFLSALLAHGLDPNATNFQGLSLLSVAGQRGDSKICQLLKAAAERQK